MSPTWQGVGTERLKREAESGGKRKSGEKEGEEG